MSSDESNDSNPEIPSICDENIGLGFHISPSSLITKFSRSKGNIHYAIRGQTGNHPSIKISGYKGVASVYISLVTKSKPYKPHPFVLCGPDCKNGVFFKEFQNETMTLDIKNVYIKSSRYKETYESMNYRKKKRLNPFGTGYSITLDYPKDKDRVRLLVQVIIGKETISKKALLPLVSSPIYDYYSFNKDSSVSIVNRYLQSYRRETSTRKETRYLKSMDRFLSKQLSRSLRLKNVKKIDNLNTEDGNILQPRNDTERNNPSKIERRRSKNSGRRFQLAPARLDDNQIKAAQLRNQAYADLSAEFAKLFIISETTHKS